MNKFDRYLKLTAMARRKYYGFSGTVTVSVGGKPTRYAKVCEFIFQWLLNRSATLGDLRVGQWFAFKPTDGTWSECYKYQGNGWHGRVYSGGPWHKPVDTQVYVLSDELQAICDKQEQALIDLYSERCEHTGMTRDELEALCGTQP